MEQEIEIIGQPAYFPGLATSKFWLFDYIKQRLTNQPDVQSSANITKILNFSPKKI